MLISANVLGNEKPHQQQQIDIFSLNELNEHKQTNEWENLKSNKYEENQSQWERKVSLSHVLFSNGTIFLSLSLSLSLFLFFSLYHFTSIFLSQYSNHCFPFRLIFLFICLPNFCVLLYYHYQSNKTKNLLSIKTIECTIHYTFLRVGLIRLCVFVCVCVHLRQFVFCFVC